MIEHGHVHHLRPTGSFQFEDGSQETHSQCVCGLEEQRRWDQEGRPLRLQYRFNRMWVQPLDLLRVATGIPVEECETCHGVVEVVGEPCERCGGLGVTENGERVGQTRPLALNPAD